MKSVAERSLRVMEQGIPKVIGKLNCSIENNIMSSDVDYVYNPKTGMVLEIWSHNDLDPGKRYHNFNVETPINLLYEGAYEITNYFPPDGITLEAKQNLEDAVRLFNQKYGYSHL